MHKSVPACVFSICGYTENALCQLPACLRHIHTGSCDLPKPLPVGAVDSGRPRLLGFQVSTVLWHCELISGANLCLDGFQRLERQEGRNRVSIVGYWTHFAGNFSAGRSHAVQFHPNLFCCLEGTQLSLFSGSNRRHSIRDRIRRELHCHILLGKLKSCRTLFLSLPVIACVSRYSLILITSSPAFSSAISSRG